MRFLTLVLILALTPGLLLAQQDHPPVDDSELPILKVGETLEGEITEDDPVIETEILKKNYTQGPTRGETFRIQVEESGSYYIDLKSYFFDGYLILRDEDGNVMAEDDDGLLGIRSRIVHKLEAGSGYCVNACALHGGTGPLEIVIARGRPERFSPLEKTRLAIEDARERLRRVEALRGPDHPDVARSLNSLGVLLDGQGLFSEARSLYERSLLIREKTLGPDHPDVATSLNNLANLLESQGLFSEARSFHERSLGIIEKTLGSNHPYVADSLSGLARVLLRQGLFSEARPLFERSLGIREKSLGSDHPHVAISLNNLANLLERQGLFSKARPLYERSLGIREKVLGTEHLDVANSLNNLGFFLFRQGLSSEARPYLERSIRICEKSLGSDHPYVAIPLNNLAILLDSQGLSAEARPLYERSLRICEKYFGREHPDVANPLKSLADSLCRQGLFSEARPLYERSLGIREKVLGPDHPDVASSLEGLAVLLHNQSLFSEARPLYERSLGIRENVLGLDHPDVASSLHCLAILEADLGNGERACELARRALFVRENQLEATLWSQSESERLRFAAGMTTTFEVFLSLDVGPGKEKVAVASDDIVSAVLSFKGKVARSLLENGLREVAALSVGERALVEQLRFAQKNLSDALYEREVADREAHGRGLEELRKRRNELEVELARSRRKRGGEGEKERGKGWERGEEAPRLRRALPVDAAVVDFLVHRVYEPAQWTGDQLEKKGCWTSRVSAFVVRRAAEEVPWLDLGETAVLEEATKVFLEELVTRRGVDVASQEGTSSTTLAAERLRELLWDPLRQAIGDTELLIVSPDTFLGTLPFEVLQEKDGSYLLEKYSFVYLQDLLSLVDLVTEAEEVSPRLLAAGSIDYTKKGKIEQEDLKPELIAQIETRGGYPTRWNRLPFSGREAGTIAGMFEEMTDNDRKATLLLGRDATEEVVKKGLETHTHVHLATHGYFQPDALPSAWKNAREEMEKDRGFLDLERTERHITGLLPGLLSGLVFAGANAEPEEGRDNGLLTAEEVTYLDLSNCDLIVLSACETGLGHPESGEGMIGLRRSFRMASARTVISSLWKVGDDATQELMEMFYENLWLKKMGKLEALRTAQLEMLKRNRAEYGEGLPSTWGAFVLDGDWR